MLFRPRKVAGSVSEMCLRKRQRRQEVTGSLEHSPRLRKPPTALPAHSGVEQDFSTSSSPPREFRSFQTSVATLFHTRKHIPGIPKVLQGSGQLNPSVCPPGKLHQWDQNTQALNMSLGLFHHLVPSPIHRLHTCPAGPLRIRAREAH